MVRCLFFVLLLIHGAAAAGKPGIPPSKWQTLSGEAPAIIARGGFSGLFPESSQYAYQFALSQTSVSDVVVYCDLQLSKDGAGICKEDLRLDNSTNIASAFPKGQKTYSVNGKPLKGWFSVDFTADQLLDKVAVMQNIFSRPSVFDGTMPLATIEDVTGLRPSQFWLNVQYNSFFKEHGLDATEYISAVSKEMYFHFISSPEIGFLKGITGKVGRGKAKLIFRFLEQDAVESSTKSTYGSLLKDLATIKSFAAGILVPKNYIWPVGPDQYLQPSTTLVADAHKLGLEVYVSGFANDFPGSYNYSFDPVAEYLQFVDNADFSVDGVLTDFPSTASEAIACFAHNKNSPPPNKNNPLIITHNGASGVFAGCTDLAYQQAVKDGADVIDCSVQMSKDGVPFCLDSADLTGDTTAMTTFMSRSSMVPEIQNNSGIFSFDLTWSEIQSLKPQLVSPLSQSGLVRNPAAKSQGKFTTLPEFLDFAKNSTVRGVLINIENAAYLASKKGLGVVDAVSSALTNASFDKQTTQQVFIQSDDTSVLSKFKSNPGYKRILTIDDTISGAPQKSIDEIKQFADSVNVLRSSIVATSGFFLSSFTDVVTRMQKANISVYVSVLRNEFMTVAFDFFSDPVMEIATYMAGAGVDGIVTEFPATASAYLRTPCSNLDAKLPYTILPVQPGALLGLAPPDALPPAEPPAPVLDAADVVDPPLPPVLKDASQSPPVAAAPAGPKSSAQSPMSAVNVRLCLFLAVLSLMCLSFH